MPQYQISKPPFHESLTDNTGKMSRGWQRYFGSLHNMMANNFNTSGTQIPPVNSNDVATTDNGVMYYNNEDNTFDGFVNGVRHEFTTTPK